MIPKNFSKIFKISLISFIIGLLSFSISLAAEGVKFKQFADNLTNNVLTTLGTLAMTAAFLFFFYGVVVFIIGRVSNKGDLKDLERGRQFMLWGLIALFVMVSAWGLIKLAQEILGVEGGNMNIEPVQIIMQGGSVDPNVNLRTPGDPAGDTSALFAKAEGESCIVLPGSESECQTGMFCRGPNGSSLAIGKSGTCQKEVVVDLNVKYKRLIDYAQTKIMNNSLKKIEVNNGVLYIKGQIIAKIDYDELWKIYGEIDPNFRSNDVVMSVTVY